MHLEQSKILKLFLARKEQGRGKGKERESKELDVHKSDINLIEHSENVSPSSTERIGTSRDGRINKEVESQVK